MLPEAELLGEPFLPVLLLVLVVPEGKSLGEPFLPILLVVVVLPERESLGAPFVVSLLVGVVLLEDLEALDTAVSFEGLFELLVEPVTVLLEDCGSCCSFERFFLVALAIASFFNFLERVLNRNLALSRGTNLVCCLTSLRASLRATTK